MYQPVQNLKLNIERGSQNDSFNRITLKCQGFGGKDITALFYRTPGTVLGNGLSTSNITFHINECTEGTFFCEESSTQHSNRVDIVGT